MESGMTGAPAMGQNPAAQDLIGTVSAISNSLMNEVGKVIIGKPQNLRRVTVGILSNGNMLLEDFPGLAKTLLANTFARALGCKFKRVQFTPDLLPSDIMGTYMYDQKSGEFKLRAGPLFCNILLADEINRAPPKTQAALLEAMEEKQVTIEGITHKLPAPFVVLATQNPIDQEGTYQLPEAQLDRFLLNPVIQYLPEADEIRMVGDTTGSERPLPEAVLSGPEIETLQYLTRQVPAPESVVSYAVRLVSASRPGEAGCDPWIAERIKWGAGSRGSQALVLSAKARALLNGRPNASREDIRAMAISALRHRILPSFLAESEGLSSDDLIDRLLDQVSE